MHEITKKVNGGEVLEVKVLRWDEEDWEFDCPVLILSPVLRYSPNGDSAESMAESLGIDLMVDGEVKSEDNSIEFESRGWNIEYLNRVWNQARDGKKFPKKSYKAYLYELKFPDDINDLDSIFTMTEI